MALVNFEEINEIKKNKWNTVIYLNDSFQNACVSKIKVI